MRSGFGFERIPLLSCGRAQSRRQGMVGDRPAVFQVGDASSVNMGASGGDGTNICLFTASPISPLLI